MISAPDITWIRQNSRVRYIQSIRVTTLNCFYFDNRWQTWTMVQQAAQVKFTILTTILQAGMAVVFGIMVRCVGGRRSLIIKSHWPDIAYICNTLCILSSLVCFPRYDKSADSAYTPNRIKNDDLTAILNQYPSLWNVNILPISLPNILPSDYWHSRHVVCGLWFPDDLPPEVRLQRHQLHHHHHSHRHWVRHPPNRLYQAWARGVRHWD